MDGPSGQRAIFIESQPHWPLPRLHQTINRNLGLQFAGTKVGINFAQSLPPKEKSKSLTKNKLTPTRAMSSQYHMH
jgi:hypothetical protein